MARLLRSAVAVSGHRWSRDRDRYNRTVTGAGHRNETDSSNAIAVAAVLRGILDSVADAALRSAAATPNTAVIISKPNINISVEVRTDNS